MGNLAKGASSLVGSPALVAAMLSFTIAQICKVFTHYHTTGKVDWGRLVGSGGMPSSHTALVVGLTTAIGLKDALDSSIFALCLVFSLVVRAFRGQVLFFFQRHLESGLERSFSSLWPRERGAKEEHATDVFLSLSLFSTGHVRCHRRSSPRWTTSGSFKSAHRRAPARSSVDG